jgi:RND family efflux transporter MFP subunit
MADNTDVVVTQPSSMQAGARMLPAVVQQPAAPPAPSPTRRRWLWGIGGLLAVGLAGLLYLQPWTATAPDVSVERVTLGPVTRVLAVNGRIAGVQSVDVRPQVAGILAEVLVAEGDVVKAGAALARVDAAAQQAFVRQALAGLDAARVVQEGALVTYARTKSLKGNVSRAVLESDERTVQAAAQEVARMTALHDQAKIQLKKFMIRAPLAGTVLVLNAEPGQNVDLATVLMTIADLGQLVVETDVDEAYATQIQMGQPAALQLSGESTVREGHVSFVSQKVDEATGGLAVKLTPEAAVTAPIGLTVTANITVDDRALAITVPRTALQKDADGDAVLVVTDGIARRRAVVVIDWPAARLIVTGGLALSDVVVADATGIADGQAVHVVQP